VPAEGREGEYLAIAEALRRDLARTGGFVSIERFRSLGDPPLQPLTITSRGPRARAAHGISCAHSGREAIVGR